MRTRVRVAALLVLVVRLAFAAPAGAQTAGSAEVLLARAPAEVVSRGQNTARPLAPGMRLVEGDRIRTGRNGAVEVRLGDGGLLRLAELSELEIDRMDVDPTGAVAMSRFSLATGRVRAWVARQIVARIATAQGAFAIQTPTAVAAVRQTDFAVLHDASGLTRVYVLGGGVETTAVDRAAVLCVRNRWTQVVPGRDPDSCRVIPLRERRDLLKTLAFEAVRVAPGDLDEAALDSLGAKLSGERVTGGRLFGGPPQRAGRDDAASREAPVGATVNVE
jgi:FecR protein